MNYFSLSLGFLLLVAPFRSLAALAKSDAAADRRQAYDLAAPAGPHHRWQTSIAPQTNELGQVTTVTNRYVELQTGMHYLENGQWLPTQEKFEIEGDEAVAKFGPHKVRLKGNLKSSGGVDLTTPDGKRFRSHILGLSYYDAASGRSVLLAETVNAAAEIVPPNQVIYKDAFDSVKASVRYTFTKTGFEQDVIVLEAIPSPKEWGLDPATTRLEVLTEMVEAPEPQKKSRTLKKEADPEKRAAMAEPDLVDEDLDFGEMKMSAGKAFSIDGQQEDRQNSFPIVKRWAQMNDRQFLIEAIEFETVQPKLETLKEKKENAKPRRQASLNRQLPERLTASASGSQTREVQFASAPYAAHGLVLDYAILNHTYNLSITNTATFHVTGDVMLNGTTCYDAGFLKIAQNYSVFVQGQFLAMTTNSWLVVVSADDYSGYPAPPYQSRSGSYYARAGLHFLYPDVSTTLRNVRFRDATVAVRFTDVPFGGMSHWLENVRFDDCQTAVLADNSRVTMTNIMVRNVVTNYTGTGGYYINPAGIRTDASSYFPDGGSAFIGLQEAIDSSIGISYGYQNFNYPWYGNAVHHNGGALHSGMWNFPNKIFDGDQAVAGPPSSGVGSTWMTAWVTGPATISFFWRTDTLTGDNLKFSINSSLQKQMSGWNMGWIREEFVLPNGSHFLEWRYDKVSSGTYGKAYVDNFRIITPAAQNPEISPPGGTSASNFTVTLSCATPGAEIRYTTNGSEPTTGSTLYSAPFSVTSTAVVKAKAFKTGIGASGTTIASFVKTSATLVSPPVFSPLPQLYDRPTSVGMTSGTAGASIYYTTNGATPTTSSTLYSAPVLLKESRLLRAKAFKSGMLESEETSGSYTISYTAVEEALDNFDLVFDSGASNWLTRVWSDGSDEIYTPTLAPSATHYLRTTVTGPGVLAFRWWISSPQSNDRFRLLIDGAEQAAISVDNWWVNESFSISAGSHEIRWEYVNSSASSGSDVGYLDAVTFTPNATSIVGKPVFSHNSGTYFTPVNLAISSGTAGATIYYTTDGTAPTTNSTVYSSPIPLSTYFYGRIRARAFKAGMLASEVAGVDLTVGWGSTQGDIMEAVDNFVLTFEGTGAWSRTTSQYALSGAYADSLVSDTTSQGEGKYVQTSVAGPGTFTFYWMIGAGPNDYLAFEIDGVEQARVTGATWAWAQKSYAVPAGNHVMKWRFQRGYYDGGDNACWLDAVVFTPASNVTTPTITPNGGTFTSATNVTLASATSGATIYYTLHGGEPTTSSPQYSAPFSLPYSATLKAKAVKSGLLDSAVASAAFTINQSYTSTDSDGDGLPDQWEQQYFGNLNQAALGDWDGDGISNLKEYQNGTSPRLGLTLQVFTKLR